MSRPLRVASHFPVPVLLLSTLALWSGEPVAARQPPASASGFSAYATGTAIHGDSLKVAVGGTQLHRTGVAVSAATVDSEGLQDSIVSEMEQVVQPAAGPAKKSYARAASVDGGVAEGTSFYRPLIMGEVAEETAPPSAAGRPDGTSASGRAGLLDEMAGGGAEAYPVWSTRTCVIGEPLSFATGHTSGVDLPGIARTSDLSRSRSFTYLTPNPDGTFGLVSEARVRVAPVRVLEESGETLTVELLGEWRLRAVATGQRGGASLTYGPVGADGETPVIRLTSAGRVTELTVQEVLGADGVSVPGHPAVSIAIGEDPRPIASPGQAVDPAGPPDRADDGTLAAGAVDIVRVTSLEPAPSDAPRALDVRIGHMETRAAVPPGGVPCPMPVRKTGAPTFAAPGEDFTWTISIPSASDAFDGLRCDLADVAAVDTARAAPGVTYAITSASHRGVVHEPTVTWNHLGTYRPGSEPIVVTVQGRVGGDSARGFLTDTVEVTASLANCTGGAAGRELLEGLDRPIAVRGMFTLSGPTVSG